MFNALRLLLRRGGPRGPTAPLPDLTVFQAWAESRGFAIRRARGVDGCVLEGRLAGRVCRVEWGPSQRSYIDGLELRLMADAELSRDLMLLLLNRALMARLEQSVYEQFIDDLQTRIDTESPAEVRWLVMFSRAGTTELGRLRERYGAATNLMPWLVRWLATPFNDALAATIEAVPPEHPVAITLKSGRMVLRTAMPSPDAALLTQWVSVFEHGLREALAMGASWRHSHAAGPQTQPQAWALSEAIDPTRLPDAEAVPAVR